MRTKQCIKELELELEVAHGLSASFRRLANQRIAELEEALRRFTIWPASPNVREEARKLLGKGEN